MLAPGTYMSHLKAYLNDAYVVGLCAEGGGNLILTEDYYEEGDPKPKTRVITLEAPSTAIGIRLDFEERDGRGKKTGVKPPLFHFLDNNGKEWSKRCDFVLFWVHKQSLMADCIEFKSKSLAKDKIVPQLRAGVNWCRSLKHVIDNYTGERRRIKVRRFVFGTNEAPGEYLDANRQLHGDPAVRYYHYDEVNGKSVLDLTNNSVQDL